MKLSRLFTIILLTICFVSVPSYQGVAQSKSTDTPMINCVVKPLREIKISVPISGVVSEVMVNSGSAVIKGDIIVRLDSDLARADLALAEQKASFKALLEAAQTQEKTMKNRVKRMQAAFSRKSISIDEYEDAKQQYELSKSNIAREEQALAIAMKEAKRARVLVEKTIVRSPADGIIGEDLVNPSEAIGDNHIATLYVTKSLRAEAFMPIALSSHMRKGGPYQLVINDQAMPKKDVKIDYFSPTVNLSSNTISVYFTINSEAILPGHRCGLKLQGYSQSG